MLHSIADKDIMRSLQISQTYKLIYTTTSKTTVDNTTNDYITVDNTTISNTIIDNITAGYTIIGNTIVDNHDDSCHDDDK